MELEIGQYRVQYKDKIMKIKVLKKNKSSYTVDIEGDKRTLWNKEGKLYFVDVEYYWGRSRDVKNYVKVFSEHKAKEVEISFNIKECNDLIKKYDRDIEVLENELKRVQDKLNTLNLLRENTVKIKKELENKYMEVVRNEEPRLS